MQFYESKCGAADGSLCSLGDRGKHLFENVRNSLKRDRRKLLVYRAEKVNVDCQSSQRKMKKVIEVWVALPFYLILTRRVLVKASLNLTTNC
jgi:hypothetical protein